jgi:protease-4
MSRGWKIFLIVAGVLIVGYAVLLGVLLAGSGTDVAAWGAGSGTVGVIELDGVIAADGGGSLFSAAGIDPITTVELLRDVDADSSIDAVVLRVNSPGGSPAASWEIYQAVSEMGKPVVVSVADVAASGAYYLASAADLIVAAPGSQVGSIGVILMAQDLEQLYEKLGIRYTVITKGKYKDIGSSARPLTGEEKRILDGQMQQIYDRFIADVATGRENLDEEQVRELATGLTYPGEEAQRLGLVDEVGSFSDALDAAAREAGFGAGDYRVRYVEPQTGGDLLSLLFGYQNKALRQIGVGLADGLRESLAGSGQPRLE